MIIIKLKLNEVEVCKLKNLIKLFFLTLRFIISFRLNKLLEMVNFTA